MENRKGIIAWGLVLCLSLPFAMAAEDIGPKWQIGDRWSVETQTVQSASSANVKAKKGVEWNFVVSAQENVLEQACFRVDISCGDTSRPQPNVTIWVNCQSGMLVRLTSRVPVEGTYRSYTENYVTSNGAAAPVLGIIPSLPLDLPVFNSAARNAKSLDPMVYESFSGNGQTKDISEINFSYAVTQTVSAVAQNNAKSLFEGEPSAKSVQVNIAAGTKTVNQVWTSGKPWPVYSANGTAVSRLKSFIPADNKEEK